MPSCWLPQTPVDVDFVDVTHMSPLLSRPSNVSTRSYDILALLLLMNTYPDWLWSCNIQGNHWYWIGYLFFFTVRFNLYNVQRPFEVECYLMRKFVWITGEDKYVKTSKYYYSSPNMTGTYSVDFNWETGSFEWLQVKSTNWTELTVVYPVAGIGCGLIWREKLSIAIFIEKCSWLHSLDPIAKSRYVIWTKSESSKFLLIPIIIIIRKFSSDSFFARTLALSRRLPRRSFPEHYNLKLHMSKFKI